MRISVCIMLGLDEDGRIKPGEETEQALKSVVQTLRARQLSPTERAQEEAKRTNEAILNSPEGKLIGQAITFVKDVKEAVKGGASTTDKINAFAPVVSLGLGALTAVGGAVGVAASVASGVFTGTKAFLNIKEDLKSDKDILAKFNEILPEVIAGGQATIGLASSAVNLAGAVGKGIGNAVSGVSDTIGDIFGGGDGQTGLSAGNQPDSNGFVQTASGIKVNPDNILEQLKLRQDADVQSIAKTGSIIRDDAPVFSSEGIFAFQSPLSEADESSIGGFGQLAENVDATGRLIRTESTPIPGRKPIVPETARPSFDLDKAPVFNDEKIRQEILLNNDPAKFEIKENPDLKPDIEEQIKISLKNESFANKTVQEHDPIIERLAKKHGVDPDMVRAIMWTENARGNKGGLNRLADSVGLSDSQTPMNINGDIWRPLIGKERGSLNNPEENIEAGVILIKRISDRIDKPTPAKIGSIWNFTGQEEVVFFGDAIGRAFEQKPWTKKR